METVEEKEEKWERRSEEKLNKTNVEHKRDGILQSICAQRSFNAALRAKWRIRWCPFANLLAAQTRTLKIILRILL